MIQLSKRNKFVILGKKSIYVSRKIWSIHSYEDVSILHIIENVMLR